MPIKDRETAEAFEVRADTPATGRRTVPVHPKLEPARGGPALAPLRELPEPLDLAEHSRLAAEP